MKPTPLFESRALCGQGSPAITTALPRHRLAKAPRRRLQAQDDPPTLGPTASHGLATITLVLSTLLNTVTPSDALAACSGALCGPSSSRPAFNGRQTLRTSFVSRAATRGIAADRAIGRRGASASVHARTGRVPPLAAVDGIDDSAEFDGDEAAVVEGVVVGDVVQSEGGSQAEIGDESVSGVFRQSGVAGAGKSKKKRKVRKARLTGEALRDDLIRRERQEEEAVLAVNTQFYRARAYKEIDDLEEVWDQSELSECIRNVGGVLKGYNQIMEEYKTEFLLAKKQEKPGLRPFKIRNLKVQTCGTLAWVTCIEDMRSPYKPYPKTVQLVTNVFRKSSKGWRLTRHHASDRDTSINRTTSGGSGMSSELGGSDGPAGNSLTSHFVDENGQVTQVSATMFRVSDGEIRPVDLSELTGRSSDGDERTVEISISESNDEDEDEDDNDDHQGDDGKGSAGPLPQWLRNMIQDKVKAIDKTDLRDIMRRRQANGSPLPENLKEGVHWEYKDGVPVVSDQSLTSGDKQRLGERRQEETETDTSEQGSHVDRDGDEEDGTEEKLQEEDMGGRGGRESGSYGKKLTRETVEAVRSLAEAGQIKDREKQLLLADVIRTASWHAPSNIETAFEVLMHAEHGDDFDTTGREEFVDQCKAYAAQLAKDQNRRRPWWKFWARK